MSLPTVEAPTTASLGPGGRHPLPPLNLPRPVTNADHADDYRLVVRFVDFESVNIDKQAKDQVAELADAFKRLGSKLSGNRSHNMKATAEYLTVLAVMSLFLAVIQIIFIQFTAGSIIGYSSIYLPARAAFNFFSFGALILNILGAVFALIYARTLFKTVDKVNDLYRSKASISLIIWDTLDQIWKFYQDPGSGRDLASFALPHLEKTCRGINEDVQRLGYIVEHHLDANYAVWTVITAGVVFFFVALFIFMIVTQPGLAMWVPTVVLATLMVVWLLLEEWHRNPDLWKELPLISGWLIARRDRRHNINTNLGSGGAASV